ncbi:MAG: hypothetical protein QW331_01995 [Candidatus Woesearchaeota archaeon]
MRKNVLVFTVMALFLVSIATADIYKINIEGVNPKIFKNETAEFKIHITNSGPNKLSFRIYSPDVEWVFETVPTTDNFVEVEPGQIKDVMLNVRPTKSIILPGPYGIPLNIRNEDTDRLERHILQVYIKGENGSKQYEPNLVVTPESKQILDPREPFNLKLISKNQNTRKLDEVSLSITSDIEGVSKNEIVSFLPLGKKTFEYDFKLNPAQKPGTYEIKISFMFGNESLLDTKHIVEIIPVTPPFEKDISFDDGFIIDKLSAKVKNTGNAEATQKVFLPVSGIDSWFSSPEPEAKFVKKEEEGYEWKLTLAPNETKTIAIVISYTPIIYLLILAIVFVVLYLVLKRPIEISKIVENVHLKEETIRKFTVVLKLRNEGRISIRDVEVRDSIPDIVVLDRHFEGGILKPHKILGSERGTTLIWKIEDIEPNEERIIRYNVHAKFPVADHLGLERAKASFVIEGKEKMSFSEKVIIKVPPKKEE